MFVCVPLQLFGQCLEEGGSAAGGEASRLVRWSSSACPTCYQYSRQRHFFCTVTIKDTGESGFVIVHYNRLCIYSLNSVIFR